MAQSNPGAGNQRNENIVGPEGAQGGNFVHSTIVNPTFIINQSEQRRNPSATSPLDEDVASFLARLNLNDPDLSEIFRREKLSLEEILKLSHEDLKDIGVIQKHRKIIKNETERLQSEAEQRERKENRKLVEEENRKRKKIEEERKKREHMKAGIQAFLHYLQQRKIFDIHANTVKPVLNFTPQVRMIMIADDGDDELEIEHDVE